MYFFTATLLSHLQQITLQQITLHLDIKVWWFILLSSLILNDVIIFLVVFVVDFEDFLFRVKLSYSLLILWRPAHTCTKWNRCGIQTNKNENWEKPCKAMYMDGIHELDNGWWLSFVSLEAQFSWREGISLCAVWQGKL